MIVAGEGTSIQAVLLGLVWVAWSGVMVIWPRQSLVRFRRHDRSRSDDWPVPEARPKPYEPSDRVVAAYRFGGVLLLAFGLFLTSVGIARL